MHIEPADEQRISEIERGFRCEAVIPLPPGGPLLAGDTVLFAHSESRAGLPPSYVKGGDSVLVSLTQVTDLGASHPDTGRALVRIAWEPLGQSPPPDIAPGRGGKPRRPQRTT